MSKINLAAGAAVALALTVGQVAAGGRAVSCYAPVHHPAEYETVLEQVMVRPGGSRIEVEPAVWGVEKREVMLEPERISYRVIPAQYDTVYETEMIRPGGTSWQWKWIGGKRIWCEVEHPPVYGKVARTVLVRPAEREEIVIPARYGMVKQRVLIREAREHVVEIPPVYRTVARKLKVREASSSWHRVSIRGHCGY